MDRSQADTPSPEGTNGEGTNGTMNGINTTSTDSIPDIQGLLDRRNIAIDRVGVSSVTYPMQLASRDNGDQTTIAKINMYVALPAAQKGTHMSRFLEVLNEQTCKPLSPDHIPALTQAIRTRLKADQAHFEAEFTYFVKKLAPVTKQPGLMDYKARFSCTATKDGTDMIVGVSAPATSLCPCSKEISEYGAHNQRCEISAEIRSNGLVWIEDLVELLEASASHPVYAVLKRPDEKFVTERAYENPKFVEDIVRDLAISLNDDERVTWYHIRSENFESIHSHNAYAEITRQKE